MKRKNKLREMLKNSVKMGVSKIVKNVKFYCLKFILREKKCVFLRFFWGLCASYRCKKAVYES